MYKENVILSTNLPRWPIAALGFASLLVTVGVALAAPADIDPSFSQDGRVTIDKGKSEKASSVALQPTGSSSSPAPPSTG